MVGASSFKKEKLEYIMTLYIYIYIYIWYIEQNKIEVGAHAHTMGNVDLSLTVI
jgi:hypothetical protein